MKIVKYIEHIELVYLMTIKEKYGNKGMHYSNSTGESNLPAVTIKTIYSS